jgi:hypothetical protein
MASLRWMAAAAMAVMLGAASADEPAAISLDAANAPVAARAPAALAESRIAFSSRNIWNWHVVDDQTLLIQSNSRKWYQAKLLGNCTGLRFVERVGFKSNADDSFDKFSSIQVRDGQRCQLVSLTESDGPPKKPKKPAPAPAAEAAKP